MRQHADYADLLDAKADEDFRALARPVRRPWLPTLTQAICAAFVIAGLTVLAQGRMRAGAEPRSWIEPPVSRSAARASAVPTVAPSLLRLDADPSGTPVQVDPPRWNAASGLREDALTSGRFDAIETPFLRVVMTETMPAAPPETSLFVTLARRAAQVQGLSVLRTGGRAEIETKFGPVQTVELVLGGEGRRSCTGFQSVSLKSASLDGWLCGILGQAPEPEAVVCALDRLALSGPAAPTIESEFALARTRRVPACASAERQPSDVTGTLKDTTPYSARKKNEAQLRRITQARP